MRVNPRTQLVSRPPSSLFETASRSAKDRTDSRLSASWLECRREAEDADEAAAGAGQGSSRESVRNVCVEKEGKKEGRKEGRKEQ
jgi:hypothetical protein